jgi:hypothetical protein
MIHGKGEGNPPTALLNYPEDMPVLLKKEIWTIGSLPPFRERRSLHQKFFSVFHHSWPFHGDRFAAGLD